MKPRVQLREVVIKPLSQCKTSSTFTDFVSNNGATTLSLTTLNLTTLSLITLSLTTLSLTTLSLTTNAV